MSGVADECDNEQGCESETQMNGLAAECEVDRSIERKWREDSQQGAGRQSMRDLARTNLEFKSGAERETENEHENRS